MNIAAIRRNQNQSPGETPPQVSYKICENFKNTYVEEHLRATASDQYRKVLKWNGVPASNELRLLFFTYREKCPYQIFSGPYFPTFGVNTERYDIQSDSECGKIRTKKSPNTDTVHVVPVLHWFLAQSILKR